MLTSSVIGLAAALFLNGADLSPKAQDVRCLATTVFTESRSLGHKAQLAVAEVALERSKRTGKSICEVVAKGWYGRKDIVSRVNLNDSLEAAAWTNALMVSLEVTGGTSKPAAPGATHFYQHNRVHPSWARKMKVVARYGTLTFMREA